MSDWKKNCAWYESAVFYHIYPLGMCGVEKHRGEYEENGEPRRHFAQMEKLIPHSISDLALNRRGMVTKPSIIIRWMRAWAIMPCSGILWMPVTQHR